MLMKQARKNHCYFLCLLDWRDFMLSKAQIDALAKTLGLRVHPPEPPIGWHVGDCPGIAHDEVRSATIGIAHSRIILDFELKDIALNTFWDIRRIREELENQVVAFLEQRAIPAMQPILEGWEKGGPRIFVYPVIEVGTGERFWKDLTDKKPFNIPTTCFHARLRDREGLWGLVGEKTVKMRVSGAKIIATEMSNRFFWELVNVVYYQGLYRQSRESTTSFPVNRVHRSLENRLEEFGREFATTFYQLGSGRMLEGLNRRLVAFTVILVILTMAILGAAAAALVISAGD